METEAEPSAYELYRDLKAAGLVSSVTGNGELLVAVGVPVPDKPASGPSTAVRDDKPLH